MAHLYSPRTVVQYYKINCTELTSTNNALYNFTLAALKLLNLFEGWLSNCFSYVKWKSLWSGCFNLSFGIRQGSVLIPLLFAVYINDIAELFNFQHGVHVVVYADDIMLLTSSVSVLQKTLEVCQRELENLDMVINERKLFVCASVDGLLLSALIL